MGLREIGLEVEWIYLAQDRGQCRAVVRMVRRLQYVVWTYTSEMAIMLNAVRWELSSKETSLSLCYEAAGCRILNMFVSR